MMKERICAALLLLAGVIVIAVSFVLNGCGGLLTLVAAIVGAAYMYLEIIIEDDDWCD